MKIEIKSHLTMVDMSKDFHEDFFTTTIRFVCEPKHDESVSLLRDMLRSGKSVSITFKTKD